MKEEILEFTFPIPITIDGKNYKIIKEIFDINKIDNRAALRDVIVIDSENQELSLSAFPDGSKMIADMNFDHFIRADVFHHEAGTIFKLTVWDYDEV